MHGRPLRRAAALALTALLVFAATAMADQLLGDGDVLTDGIQGTAPLGNVTAGAEISVEVEFTLNCVGLGHVDIGQTVLLTWGGLGSAPPGGAIVSVTPGSVGPVVAPWAVDNEGCPSPTPSITGTTTRSTVTLRAPTTPANGYMYTVVFDRALTPGNPSDGNAFSRTATQVSFTLNVVGNTAPTLTVPASFSVQGNSTGGWIADWSGVSATDPEDNPDPTPTCNPPAGSVIPFGTTTVTCSVTDSGGASDTDGFAVTVLNSPPTLNVPASFSVEGNTIGGWTADWSGVSATDPEDNPDPTPTCDPAAGSILPIGTSAVTCSVTDSAGASDTDGFAVTVQDTTRPDLVGMPGDRSVTTTDPTGAVVTYTPPTATDIVDPSPSVSCSPASGEKFPVGPNTVTCTATDATGNSATASFSVDVRLEQPPHAASAIWMEPVGDDGDAFEANHSRTIPVKVRLFVDGVERSSGEAQLTVTPCGGGPTALEMALAWGGGRWNAGLDTSMLAGSCYVVTASIDGLEAGSFRLELHGEASAARTRNSTVTSPLVSKPGQLKPR